jgi:hypothetical protein
MTLRHFILLSALLLATVLPDRVLYSDSRHLPENLLPDILVVLLAGPERLQANMLGKLSPDPEQAAAPARKAMASLRRQQQLQTSRLYMNLGICYHLSKSASIKHTNANIRWKP